jgi:integrase
VSAAIINREIQRFEKIADDVFREFEIKKTVPDVALFKSKFNENAGRQHKDAQPRQSFFNIFDEFVRHEGDAKQWSMGTYKRMKHTKNLLLKFDPNLAFDKLDEAGLNNYASYLRDYMEFRARTVMKQISILKWFLRWAVKYKHTTNLSFQTFSVKMKTEEKTVIYLDWEELMTTYNYHIPETSSLLEKVRDVFCFCCFTSLRYSDVFNLKRSDIFNNYILVTTVKTFDSLKIELNDYSKAILDKYKHLELPNNKALPVISNQKMNDALKELGKLCGIDTPVTITYYKAGNRIDEVHPKYSLLTTHAGRRTFICNALMLGISPDIIMRWTGHSDYKAMKPYIAIADRAKEAAMNLFNRKSPTTENRD